MAQLSATPKTRSRRDGAAVALDDLDRRLLNLLQGSFALEPRPYARVGELAGASEEEVLRRTGRLVEERIIRQITPVSYTHLTLPTILLV